MKQLMATLLGACLALAALAQPHSPKELILTGTAAQKLLSGAELVRYVPGSSLPAYVRLAKEAEIPASQAPLLLQKLLAPNEAYAWTLLREQTDPLGHRHLRYQQRYEGIPVEGGRYVLHLKDGQVYALNGHAFSLGQPVSRPGISESDALAYALQAVGAERYKWEVEAHTKNGFHDQLAEATGQAPLGRTPEGTLVFAPRNGDVASGDFYLCYKFDIYAHRPLARQHVYVNAQDGEVIWQLDQLHTNDVMATAETKYSGTRLITTDSTENGYRLRESGRGGGIITLNMQASNVVADAVDFWDEDNYWNNVNAQEDEVATDAHFAAEATYDYFEERFGLNSVDDLGLPLVSYVHFDDEPGGDGYTNAFWDGQAAYFGDGGGNLDPLTTLDIVAHEFVHGLTQFSADLIYQNESGALNESFSDIFGTVIERHARPGNWNWDIGEDIGYNFRSMSNPNSRNHPDTYRGSFWVTGSFDNGGVHINSGVQNYWFFVLSEGGGGVTDFGESFQVNGISMDKAAAIAFRTLTTYLTPSSDYQDARFYSLLAAADLYGHCSEEVEAATNAWHAVGVGAPFSPEVSADFSLSPATNCKAPLEVQFQNASLNASRFRWEFGDGQTSEAISPVHLYQAAGTYAVRLIAEGGSCGSDTLLREDLVQIDASQPCVELLSNQTPVLDACEGLLYDSGGPLANYPDQQRQMTTIAPQNAYAIRLSFSEFDLEWDYDYLYLYEGTDTTGTLLGRYTGNELPEGGSLSVQAPAVTLVLASDPFVNGRGFALSWKCEQPTAAPITAFRALDTLSCTGRVQFIDESFQALQWLWDFGDGNQSEEQNPVHQYEAEGTYTVELVALNNLGATVAQRVAYIKVDRPDAPAIENIQACGSGAFQLRPEAVEGALRWYTEQGAPIVQAASLDTLLEAGIHRFGVEQAIQAPIQHLGPKTPDFGSGGIHDNSSTQYLVFDAYQPFRLEEVTVRSSEFRERKISLWDAEGELLDERVVQVSSGLQQVSLGFDIPEGRGFRLGGTRMGFYRNNSGPTYPYLLEGVANIRTSSAGEDYYYYFYDWQLRTAPCVSERTLVEVMVEAGPRPQANFQVQEEDGSFVFSDLSSEATEWAWNFGDGQGSAEQNPVHQFAQDGTYQVQLIVRNGVACVDTLVQSVSVGGTTALTKDQDGASLLVFPNPGKGMVNLELKSEMPQAMQWVVYNAMGQRLLGAASPGPRLRWMPRVDLRTYPPGTYLIQVQLGEQLVHRTYLLQK